MPAYKDLILETQSSENKARILDDAELYLIFNGQLREQIKKIIYSEFQDPKTVMELCNRIIPINIITKIITKLAKVYKVMPERKAEKEDVGDDDLISLYEQAFNIQVQMAYANRLFKLNKHCLVLPYLDKNGKPGLRVIPSHLFSLKSEDKINPEKPTTVIIHVKTDAKDEKDNRHEVWTDSNFWIVDGNGDIVMSEMEALSNPDGLNFYGIIPHVHITQQRDLLYPIRSSDLKSVQYAVCVLLSDSSLAQKYLSWGTLVLTGVDGEKQLTISPGAVISLPNTPDGKTPDAKYIQPQLNSDEVLRLVEKIVEYLLSTNNISAGTIIGQLNTSNAASGISKMLDQSESTEDIHEQQKYFIDAEVELWHKFAHNILPYWVESNQIDPKYKGVFSPEFSLSIKFPEIKPMLSDKERIENVKAKFDAGFITLKMALEEVYPEKSEEQIDDLILELNKEKKENMALIEDNMQRDNNTDEQDNEMVIDDNGNQTTKG